MIDDVCQALQTCRVRFTDEIELQNALERVLRARGFSFEREVVLDDAGRIDFVVHGKVDQPQIPEPIGIEVKIQGAVADVTRQLHRYAATGRLSGLVLATTMMRQATQLRRIGGVLGGRDFRSIYLAGTAF